MWYILIFVLIGLMLFCYRKKRIAVRFPEDIHGKLDSTLANDASVILGGCLVFVAIAAMLQGFSRGGGEHAARLMTREAQYRQVMAEYLARKVAADAPAESKALIIDDVFDEEQHKAAMEGLKAGLAGKVAISTVVRLGIDNMEGLDAKSPRDLSRAIELTSQDLDRLVAANPDCTVLISLVGLPGDFASSLTFRRAIPGPTTSMRIGIYTNNVFMLGYPISNGAISACVIPKVVPAYDQTQPIPQDLPSAFERRYEYLDRQSVVEFARLNKRLFRLTKAF